MRFSKSLAPLVLGLAAASLCVPAEAANWLQLQGTQPAAAGPRAKIWGFIQPEYQQTDGTDLDAGPFQGTEAIFNQIRPDLDTDSSFNIIRARLGVRGTAMPIDSNVDYFFLIEAGNNGITKQGGGSVKLTDASVTFNHLKGARIRVGQFKYPGAEEGLQAIHVFDYINFTNVTNQLLLERFFDGDGSQAGNPNGPNGPVGAFRDIGVQVFDWFNVGSWQHSYAAMIGNGNGITRGDNNSDKDYYLYLSSERIFGGKGPRRQGWKLFGWYQDGERTLEFVDGTAGEQEFDRTRWGLGTTFRRGRWRAAAEYVSADGMIFNGTDGGAVPGAIATAGPGAGVAVASWNIVPEGEADGWYLDGGFLVLPNLEVDLRYDVLNRLTDSDPGERKFETTTVGLQWFANKKVRVLANYEFRDAEAPNLAGNAVPNQVLDAIDDRFSVQVLAVF